MGTAIGCGSDNGGGGPGDDPSIAMTLSEIALTIVQGGSDDLTATITRTDFTGTINIATEGAPAGVTATASNVTTTGNTTSGTITVAVAASVAPGTYNLTVRASGTGVTAVTQPLTLTVTAIPTFALSLSEAALTIAATGNANTTVNIARTNFTGNVTLTLEGAPAGVTGAFAPSPATGNSSTLTVTVGAQVAPGEYDLTVKGTATGLTDQTTPLTLTVTAAPTPGYTIAVDPDPISIAQGANDEVTVTLTRTNFTGQVDLSLLGAPIGVTAAFAPAGVTGTTSTLTLTVAQSVDAGDYDLQVKGVATGLADVTVPLTLTVTVPQSYSLAGSAASIVAGQNGTSTITITRTGGFSGTVNLTVQTAPTGITGSFDPAAATGNSSVLTLTVAGSVDPGNYTVTVKGTATGQPDQTTDVAVTVTAAQNYTLSASAATIQAGQNGTSNITVTRNGGFAGTVNLTIQTAPSGVTGSFDPAAATGNSSVLTLTVGSGVAEGNYTVTVKGTATGQPDQTTDVALAVTPASSGGSITWNFSACGATFRPIWFAIQDGSGNWTRVTGSNNVYQFDINANTGGIAYVTQSGNTYSTIVFYLSKGQITGGIFNPCITTTPSGKTITGTAAGLGLTESSIVSLGGAFANPTSFATAFQLNNVQLGTFDLLGYRTDVSNPGANDKIVIQRDLNTNSISTVGTIDFGAGSAITPETAVFTTDATAGETVQVGMTYYTGASCTSGPLYTRIPASDASPTVHGVPAANQRATDYHSASVTAYGAGGGTDTYRMVTESFQTLANRTITLPSLIPLATPTVLTGPYKRLQFQFTLPSDLATSAALSYNDGNANFRAISIFATSAFLGGTALNLSTPDFSAVAGWDNSWAPASAAGVNWNATGFGTTATNACSNSARSVLSARSGAI